MLIIAGYLEVDAARRDAYVQQCVEAVEAAHRSPGCLDFTITADSVDPTRVRIYERWESDDELMAFRGSGPSDDQSDMIVGADVKRYIISSVGDA